MRPLDAAEARLEGILTPLGIEAPRTRSRRRPRESSIRAAREGSDGGFQEHEPLAGIVKGSLALAAVTKRAREALDDAHERATTPGQRRRRALDARARLADSQGASALARRDTDAAHADVEETAAKLPRDLREVLLERPSPPH